MLYFFCHFMVGGRNFLRAQRTSAENYGRNAGSIGSISKAMEEGAAGIAGVADSTRKMEQDMSDITGKMDVNQEIVEELKKQMEVFVDL